MTGNHDSFLDLLYALESRPFVTEVRSRRWELVRYALVRYLLLVQAMLNALLDVDEAARVSIEALLELWWAQSIVIFCRSFELEFK